MQQDNRLRALARAIYETVYPSAPVGFEQAEQRGTIHYRQAVEAARIARASCASEGDRQMVLL